MKTKASGVLGHPDMNIIFFLYPLNQIMRLQPLGCRVLEQEVAMTMLSAAVVIVVVVITLIDVNS